VLDFQVLGPFQVVVDGAALPVGGPQQRAVLALLTLRANEVVSVDAIVDGVWGERAPGSAIGVVRTYVSRLRRILTGTRGAHLTSRPPGYVLGVDPDHVDALRFTQLVERARQEMDGDRPDAASATLRQALGLWRGAVLADLPGLDTVRPAVTRLEELRLAAVEGRIDAELALGHHLEVVGELAALIQEHPFRERLWCQRILTLYRCGRQLDALAAYQEARTVLAEQVGAEPGPDLRALAQQVRDHADALRWPGPRRAPGPLPGESVVAATASPVTTTTGTTMPTATEGRAPIPLQAALGPPPGDKELVGRAAERALLADRLDTRGAPRLRAVLVAGPPGIGKSALVRWAAHEAHARGMTVVAGWADEDSRVPFRPLDEAIDHWVTHAEPADLHRLSEADATHLARVVPPLAERRGAPPAGPVPEVAGRRSGDVDRQQLFGAVVRWVESLAALQPALIVLEDVHWADPACLLAMRHLLRHPPSAGALLLATCRDTEAPFPDALAALLASTRGNHSVDRLDLGRLSDQDVLELLGVGPDDPHEPAARAFAVQLARRTGGNPLFVHETLRHLVRCGAIDPDAAAWGDGKPLGAYGVPPGVTELLDQRLRGLPATTTATLQRAAVLGQPFDLAVLGRTVDRPEVEVVEALEPALAAGLVTRAEGRAGAPGFGFAHGLVREAILDRLPLSQRLHIHWRAGQALAALSTSDPGRHLGEAARHLAAGAQAGDPHVALAACVRAGEQALSALAFEASAGHFTTAAAFVVRLPDADPDLAYRAWLGLGYASGVLNDVERQRDSFLRAVAVARDHRRPDGLALLVVGLAAHRLAVGRQGVDDDLFGRLVDEAHTTLGPAPSLERCCLLAFTTVQAVVQNQPGRAHDLAARTDQVAAALDTPAGEAVALMARGWTLVGGPDHQTLGSIAERALALSYAIGPEMAVPLRLFVVPLLALPALQAGDRRALEQIRAGVGAELRRQGVPHVATSWLAWDAALALASGAFGRARRLAGELHATGLAMWREVAAWQRALAVAEQGRQRAELAALAEHAGTLAAEGAGALGPVVVRSLLASFHTLAGQAAEAARHVEHLRKDPATDRYDRLGWMGPLVFRQLAEVAARHGDGDLAADLLPAVESHSGQMLVTTTGITVEAAADRAVGQLLLTLGRLDEAVEHLDAALALERSFGAHALAARTAYWQARARAARRAPADLATARHLLDQAADQARRLGMAHLHGEVEALRSRC
jgi:DNA-binding SARP family transcriptional activator/tetratricopeptide (TPR) repeat protein